MLSFIPRNCFAAALLCTLSLAEPIAFGNAAFAGITFGRPFTISWYGGDGTPVSIDLLSGNPASLQPVTTLTTSANYSGYAVSWTPVPSQSIQPGQLYALSIVQSGLTNYSPMFGISAATGVSDRVHAAYGAPIPIGTGRYYPIANREVQDHAEAHNSDVASIFPRNDGSVFPRHEGSVFPRNDGSVFPRNYGTIFQRDHVTGTPTGSGISHACATGTGTAAGGTMGRSTGCITDFRAAAATSSPISSNSEAQRLGSSWSFVRELLSAGFVLLLL